MEWLIDPSFWLAVGQIILIDILLGGDNAVVIALACRGLPEHLRRWGIIWGTAGAIVLRIVLVFFAINLLQLVGLKLVGGLLLLWIGAKLMLSDDDEHDVHASDRLWAAVRTIIVADFVMSVDNVIAIAGAAQSAGSGQQLFLVIFGLLVSIPIIVAGSQIVLKVMDRFPVVVTFGAMLLGWIAGSLIVSDTLLANWFPSPQPRWWSWIAGAHGATLVWVIGRRLQARQERLAAKSEGSA